MASVLSNEIQFNVSCHGMAKSNWSLAYNYITDIFNNSVSYKDKCNKVIKASLLTVRGFLLYIPFVNRITQLALRILSPELTVKSFFSFKEEELDIRYSEEAFSSYFAQLSKEEEDIVIFTLFKDLKEFQKELQDPDGFFVELSQEQKQQKQQQFSNFLKNPNEFQNMPQRNSLQSVSQSQLQNPENVFEELSKEEQSNLDNWAKEMNLDKDVSFINTTKIRNDLEELD